MEHMEEKKELTGGITRCPPTPGSRNGNTKLINIMNNDSLQNLSQKYPKTKGFCSFYLVQKF